MPHLTLKDQKTELFIFGSILTNDLRTLYHLKSSGVLSKCINYVDSKAGMTILMHAVMSASLDTVNLLLTIEELDINATDGAGMQWTALFQAAFSGREDCVRRLLQQPGIKIDITDSDGKTAAYYANLKGHHKIAQLLSQKATPELDTRIIAGSSAEHLEIQPLQSQSEDCKAVANVANLHQSGFIYHARFSFQQKTNYERYRETSGDFMTQKEHFRQSTLVAAEETVISRDTNEVLFHDTSVNSSEVEFESLSCSLIKGPETAITTKPTTSIETKNKHLDALTHTIGLFKAPNAAILKATRELLIKSPQACM